MCKLGLYLQPKFTKSALNVSLILANANNKKAQLSLTNPHDAVQCNC